MLDYFSRNAELGLGAQLWLVRSGSAREALSAGGEKGLDSRLETIQNDSKMGIANLTRTAGEVYTDLLELGSAYVPALTPVGEGDAVLAEQGYGILKGDILAGFLEGEAAKGLELLTGGPSADILEIAWNFRGTHPPSCGWPVRSRPACPSTGSARTVRGWSTSGRRWRTESGSGWPPPWNGCESGGQTAPAWEPERGCSARPDGRPSRTAGPSGLAGCRWRLRLRLICYRGGPGPPLQEGSAL